jgi:hypothetical protein
MHAFALIKLSDSSYNAHKLYERSLAGLCYSAERHALTHAQIRFKLGFHMVVPVANVNVVNVVRVCSRPNGNMLNIKNVLSVATR